MVGTPWGYLETYSILVRRLNGGVLDRATFTTALTALQAEVVTSPNFRLVPTRDALIFASKAILRKHNLNSTDALILTTVLDFIELVGVDNCAVVAAAKRLLRAARAEGLTTLDPEVVLAAEVPDLLAAL